MFEELGLNVARQRDNGSNPRPDNRSGWMDGEPPSGPTAELPASVVPGAETPDVITALLAHAELVSGGDRPAGLSVRLWDPSTQLRYRAKPRRKEPTALVGGEG